MKRLLFLLAAMTTALYGGWAAIHMAPYIGTGHYWSNPWFYKAHAALFATIALRIVADLAGEQREKGEGK